MADGRGGSDTPTAAGGTLWSGRFSGEPAPEARALGRSLDVDVRLAPQDVAVSIAHVAALLAAGLLERRDAIALTRALEDVGRDIARGGVRPNDADEDIHSVVERAVTERLGDVGARLHAGRSRNDLVATDLRLWLMDAAGDIQSDTSALMRVLVRRAREHAETVMPGTTHARPAQPVTLGHHLLAHAWAFARDVDRLDDWAGRTSTSPLGAGAIAGSTLGLNAAVTAERLGFQRAFQNSIDAVGDRDFVQEFLATGTILSTHTSRLSADLARWSDPALGWAELDETFTTGSSMMPHKRNPDAVELSRAKAARVAADFAAVTSMLHGLPLGYHRDLQEDKEPAFDAADTLRLVLAVLTGTVRTVVFDVAAMRRACMDEGLYATDIAEALVRNGVPFREAHRRTGELLKGLAADGRSLRELTADEWREFGVLDGGSLLEPDAAVRARGGPGGPSPGSVRSQADALEASTAFRS
jgi:argininosuccinate lyase